MFGFRKVTAVEADARRCRRLQENLERLGHGEGEGGVESGDGNDNDDRNKVVVAKVQDWTPTPDGRGIAGFLLDVP